MSIGSLCVSGSPHSMDFHESINAIFSVLNLPLSSKINYFFVWVLVRHLTSHFVQTFHIP